MILCLAVRWINIVYWNYKNYENLQLECHGVTIGNVDLGRIENELLQHENLNGKEAFIKLTPPSPTFTRWVSARTRTAETRAVATKEERIMPLKIGLELARNNERRKKFESLKIE